MKSRIVLYYSLLGVVFLGSLLAGCARKIPAPQSLTVEDQQTAQNVLDAFLTRNCGGYIDSDVTLDWSIFGNQGAVPGMLQMQAPARARYTIVDPLGRPLFILVADRAQFRAVVIPETKGYEGNDTSPAWQKYVPEEFNAGDLFVWLSGGLRKQGMRLSHIGTGKGKSEEGYWYEFTYDDNTIHHIVLDPDRNILTRHALIEEDGEVVFDVHYSDYQQTGECRWPGTVVVQSNTVTAGTVTLHYNSVALVSQFPTQTFELTFPPGFEVESVE